MTDLIFVSMENWDEVWRRNQFLCAGLTRRFPEMKILFVGVQRNILRYTARGDLRTLLTDPLRQVEGFPNVYVTRPLRFALESFDSGRRLNEAITRSHVRRAARRIGITHPLLWLNPHYAVHMVGRMHERAVVYDITDDWCLAAFGRRELDLIRRQDRDLCVRADLVVVCSKALYESRKALCRRIELIPNGVDVTHYRSVADGTAAAIQRWASPVLGYTGTLHPDRVDVGLVRSLAECYPEGTILLVGPDNLDGRSRSQLQALPNVHLTGAVPYAEVPRYMAAFDVCIVPHIESTFTESLNPIKLWEYLASGKPIASTNVAGFRDYGHLCHIGSEPDGFLRACNAALAEDGSQAPLRVAEAAGQSWDARLEQLLAALGPLESHNE